MHVIALALAHLDDNPTPHPAPVLFRGSAREVLQRVVGQAHVGFKGVLRRLPFAVLSRQGYLRLIELLDDPLCAKLLHHLEQRKITEFNCQHTVRGPGGTETGFGRIAPGH